ncbi:MAG TPA: GWxTD domain-containing protein [Acidobacteriota bacterium]
MQSSNWKTMTVFAVAMLSLLALPARAAEAEEAPVAVEQRIGDFEWFETYAPFVLTPAEMKSYKAAQTPFERQAVIEEFWRIRNPNPGSARNLYREAFYARLDYANKRFSQGIPGYKSTRGLVYVLLGAPNEYRYLNRRTGWPVETWTYWSTDSRRLPGQYTIGFDLSPGRGGILFTWFPGQTGFERALARNRSGLGGYLPPEMVAAIQDLSRKAIVPENA